MFSCCRALFYIIVRIYISERKDENIQLQIDEYTMFRYIHAMQRCIQLLLLTLIKLHKRNENIVRACVYTIQKNTRI